MKKILIRENSELANSYIQNIENVYISRLCKLSCSIIHLGIGGTTKQMLIDAIQNNSENLNRTFNELVNKKTEIPTELNGIAPIIESLRPNIEAAEYKKLDNVRVIASEFKQFDNRIYNGIAIDNPTLFNWFELNEDGMPYLLDSVKESIKESVKVYTSTNIGAEMLKLQQSLAKDIQKMYDLMSSVNNTDTTNLGFEAHNILCYRFPMGLFDVKEDRETGHKEFVPININFDPEQVENDEPFLDDED